MDDREDLYSDWIVVKSGVSYYIGKVVDDGLRSEGTVPVNCVVLSGAFEMLVLRGQQRNGETMMLTQNQAWTGLPLCTAGITMTVFYSDRWDLKDLPDSDRANYVKFIDAARENFEQNRLQNAGLVPATSKDLANLAGRGRA